MNVNPEKVLLIYGAPLFPIAKNLLEELSTSTRKIHNWSFNLDHYSTYNDDALDQYEIIILLIPSTSINDEEYVNKLSFLNEYLYRHPNKLVIPFFTIEGWSDDYNSKFPLFDPVLFSSSHGLKNVADLLARINDRFEKNILQEESNKKKAEELKKTIEESSSKHLEPIRDELQKRAERLEVSASNWFKAGYFFLIAALIAPFIIFYFSNKSTLNDYTQLIFYTIKSIVFVILSISLSKYSSNLGRAYMNESQKVSDRRHAISFGEFALKVSKEPIRYLELNEIFKEWNTRGTSSFMPSTTEDHDPKLLERIRDLILAARGKEEK